MNKEIIEKYIKFAIDNGYIFKAEYDFKRIVRYEYRESQRDVVFTTDTYFTIFGFIELITSKEFIEAIAKGLCKNMTIQDANSFFYGNIYLDERGKEIKHKYANRTREQTNNMFKKVTGKDLSSMEFEDKEKVLNYIREGLLHIDEITIEQAIARRDGKLEEFILNILNIN